MGRLPLRAGLSRPAVWVPGRPGRLASGNVTVPVFRPPRRRQPEITAATLGGPNPAGDRGADGGGRHGEGHHVSMTDFLAGYVALPGAGLGGDPGMKASKHSTGGSLSVFETTIAAGPPLHVHDHEDECFYVLEGE